MSLFFKTLHAFVLVHHESRRVVHVGVTDHPTDEWITQPVRDATPFEEKPKFLICDNDKGIAQQLPAPTVSPPGEAKAGKVMAFPVLNGLPHDYRQAAA